MIPVFDFTDLNNTIPKYYRYEGKVIQGNAFVSKKFHYEANNLLVGVNYQYKKYDITHNKMVNFSNTSRDIGAFNSFNKEQIYSVFLQDDYKFNEQFLFVLNAKIDRHIRSGIMQDSVDEQYKVGAIYTPLENFGMKAFYTKTYIAPSFYNVDYAQDSSEGMKKQRYNFIEVEAVYANEFSRLSVLFNDVKVKDFIYMTPVGFSNVDQLVESKGIIVDYTYELSKSNTLELNFFKAKLSETMNNSNVGGYLKLMGEYDSFEYFSSVIYRNGYSFEDVDVDGSYNFNLGVTYKATKNLTVSLKGENLFDDATKSLYQEGFPGSSFALRDYQRSATLSMKWMF